MRTRVLLSSLLLAAACGAEPTDDGFATGGDGKHDASAVASFLDFEWDGELVSDDESDPEARIRDQLLYTIGHLNGDNSVGRLDRLVLTNVRMSEAGTQHKVSYHAKMPVAWGSKTSVPTSYTFILPKTGSYSGFESFTTKYKSGCVEHGAHDVDSGSMWYYYRPTLSGCRLADADVSRFTVKVTASANTSVNMYPEYHKVWEDSALKVVAIFGKYEDGATTTDDAGIEAYNDFVAKTRTRLREYSLTTIPATLPEEPGVALRDITFRGTLPGGRSVEIVALLVDNVRQGGPEFEHRYEELSTHADLIAYNGHAGLGQNVRYLARKGKWIAGQYVIVFMNGCDTFAYVDGSLADTRATINPDDPTGTKYMEFVTNAMPSFFSNMSNSSWVLINGLLDPARPETYEKLFTKVSSSQVILVTGEEDNAFRPGMGGGGPRTLLDKKASVAQGDMTVFETEMLSPGTYQVVLAQDPSHPGGDADLHVRAGARPTTSDWDCRPYSEGTEERCEVKLTAASKIFAGVAGYSRGTTYFQVSVLQ